MSALSHDDNNFDFDKLERELNAAVLADEKYQRENDAKFRAVEQRVATYEEFKLVLCFFNFHYLFIFQHYTVSLGTITSLL